MANPYTQHFVKAAGAAMSCYHAGTPGARALVLAHGFSDNGLCWLPVAEDVQPDFDVFMPDARGFGLSERIERGQAVDAAADLAAVIEALGLEKPIVAGHSMGAATAANLGARFPHLVSALVLEDPPWFLPRPEQGGGIGENSPFYQWVLKVKTLPLEEAMALTRADHPTWPEPFIRYWTLGKQQMDVNTFAMRAGSWNNWQEIVRDFRCPVLLITADPERGGLVTPELAKMAREINPCIREVNIAGAGHHTRFEKYPEYMAAVKAFLNEVK